MERRRVDVGRRKSRRRMESRSSESERARRRRGDDDGREDDDGRCSRKNRVRRKNWIRIRNRWARGRRRGVGVGSGRGASSVVASPSPSSPIRAPLNIGRRASSDDTARPMRLKGNPAVGGAKFELHASLASRLYDHQREGVRWMWWLHCNARGGILADDMGLGKTLQTCAFIAGVCAKRCGGARARTRADDASSALGQGIRDGRGLRKDALQVLREDLASNASDNSRRALRDEVCCSRRTGW